MGIHVSKRGNVGGTTSVTFPTAQEIIINHADDSIKIGDGTDIADVTAANALKTDSSHVTQPVSVASLPLPASASTSALQTSSNTKLDSLLTELQLKADLSETQPVSVVSLPLPSGASTSAKQDTGNTSVASIDTKTPALGQAVMSASSPVVIASNQTALPITQSTTYVSGSFSGPPTQTLEIDCSGAGTVLADITGTWSGTISFQYTLDDITWNGISASSVTALDGNLPSYATANGLFAFPASGLLKLRLVNDGMTGTANVVLSASPYSTVLTALQAYTYVKQAGSDIWRVSNPVYSTIIDEASSTVTYIGKAEPGTSTSSANWLISKVTISGTVTSSLYADGVSTFTAVWNDRASLSYS